MSKRQLVLWCVGLAVLANLSIPDLQAQYAKPPDTYSVTEVNAMFGVPVTMHIDRDGSKAVIENSYPQQPGAASGGHTRSLYDLQEKTTITWDLLNASTPCGKSSWNGDWGDPFAGSTEMTSGLEKQHAKEIGPATINGIATKLYEADAEGTKAKIWIEPKYGLVVKLDLTGPDGVTKTVIEVKQISFSKPAASVFTLPAACAEAANAPRVQTETERIAAETGESADNFISATQGGGPSPNSCTVVVRVLRAGSMQPIYTPFQAAIDLNIDVNNPPHYEYGVGEDGHLTFGGGHLHEITSQVHAGMLRIENVPPNFELDLGFGKAGETTGTLARHCVAPRTFLLFVIKNPDKLGDGADWLWVKSGKYAK